MGSDLTTGRSTAVPLTAQLGVGGFEDAVEIGRGGFGVVYRCRQVELDRVVAVKVLTVDLEENRARFEREQQAMAKLTGHPNIVAVLQVGQTDDGRPYLVMPFCLRGCVQTEISGHGRLPLEEALRVGVAMAAGLESAHRLGIVHRDVKPANVLWTDYGDPALTDFGIAHMAGEFTTSSGLICGSPAFIAPEVIGGNGPDRASDVYGLGATLFAALTGHPPFERRSGESVMSQLLRITTDRVPDLGEQGIPSDVAAVVHRALSRDPTGRPAMVELGEALQDLQAGHGLAVDAMALAGGKRTGEVAQRSAASASLIRRDGNVPAPLAGFVGREAELAELGALISSSRLVTVTGVGGVGKSTLALQAARERQTQFNEGVWLVEIGELRDGSLLTGLVAGALGIHDQGIRPLVEVMVEALAQRETLLVLDNCEQVIDAAALLVETLLRGCSRLRIVATSREVLGVGGEAVLPLRPLAYPDGDPVLGDINLTEYDAVALFVERARTAQPGFTLTAHNAAAVARICARLDGLPLAIELAAARLRAMSVEQLAKRLSDRFGLLTRGRRGAPSRQQTLRLCIGWSFDHCTAQEQRLWARLSVFAGSFELEAARDVCAEDMLAEDLLDELSGLVDKSILIRIEEDAEVRFRLLPTLREYGETHVGADEYRRLQRRHLDWYRRLVNAARSEFFTQHQVRWINRLRREMANLQEALQFGLSDSPTTVLEMTTMLRHVWAATGMIQEGRRWVEQALSATTEPTSLRVYALIALGTLSLRQTDWATVTACVAEAREILEVLPDPVAQGYIDYTEGFGALLRGELELAPAWAKRALAATDDFEVQIMAMALMALRFSITGDAKQALHYAEQGLALAEPRRETVMRHNMVVAVGGSRLALGDTEGAERVMRDGLQRSRAIHDPWTGAQFLEMLAWVAAANNDPRRAAVLLGASAAISRASGASSTTVAFAGAFHEKCERQAREQLSAIEYETASIEGNALSFNEAAAYALDEYH